MQFDTKIALVIRTDLEPWQKLNVASFLTSGIVRRMGGAKRYPSICIFGDDGFRRLNPSYILAREVKPAVYTEDMFKTTHDAANREAVKAVTRADLNLVGLAMRAERKVIDKVVDGLKFHS